MYFEDNCTAKCKNIWESRNASESVQQNVMTEVMLGLLETTHLLGTINFYLRGLF